MTAFTGFFVLLFASEEKKIFILLIDQSNNIEELIKKESFWQHELDTFQPNGLNEREGALS